jgi:lipopolysaccharide export system protein LptC
MKLDRPKASATDDTDADAPVSGPEARGGIRAGGSVRPVHAVHRARRYSRFVAIMKLLLPSVAVAVLGVVLAWPQIQAQTDRFTLGFSSLDPRTASPSTLVNPRYHGVDERDQPYTLIAATAEEMPDDPDRVDLEQPQGDILLSGGRWIAVRGNAGLYSRIERTLDLSGDVMLYRDDGFEFHTQEAHIDLHANSAYGTDPVRGRGPDGSVVSEGFELVDGGRVVMFTGTARLMLENGDGRIAP